MREFTIRSGIVTGYVLAILSIPFLLVSIVLIVAKESAVTLWETLKDTKHFFVRSGNLLLHVPSELIKREPFDDEDFAQVFPKWKLFAKAVVETLKLFYPH